MLAHYLFVFVLGHGLWHVLVHFVHELSAMLYHFVHGAVLHEISICKAELAVVFVLAVVCICTEEFVCERHSAALTKFLILIHLILFF